MPTCLTPISCKPKKGAPAADGYFYHSVPCGKCAACRLRRIQGWVFRLRQEEKRHVVGWFVTLTYDSPPISDNGFMTLRRADLRNFFKRLRFNTGCKTIRYYACGEYGGKTMRPHYHAIIFDVTPSQIETAWTTITDEKDLVIRGYCHFGQVSDDSIAYTAKYMAKAGKIPMHDHDDRVPEYSVMSKRLGDNYLTPQVVAYHEKGRISYLTMPGGATHSMPRYYRDRIFSKDDLMHMNAQLSAKFNDAFAKNVALYGSVEEYYRAMHWAVRAANAKFNSQENRNKL